MQTKENTDLSVEDLPAMPILSPEDAADYLADILPQLALIANNSGLAEIADMVSLAARLARQTKKTTMA